MTHPLDIFRSTSSLNASCTALFPGDLDSVNACMTMRAGQAQAEIFGLLVGGALGILIGRFVLSGRK